MLIHGDCLTESEKIKTGSADLILTDLPYGTIKGLNLRTWDKSTTEWDNTIDTSKIMDIANRILRVNGKMILFAQDPFTYELINKAIPNLQFNYRLTWIKNHFANHLGCKKAPVNYSEDILVFSKKDPVFLEEQTHSLRSYFDKIKQFTGLNKKQIITAVGQRADHCLRSGSSQFELCTADTYDKFIEVFKINEMQGFRDYECLKKENTEHKEKLKAVFNLPAGEKYKSNLLNFSKDTESFHPTQKPVLLLEDLIKTYSNENNTVIDLTMGSGSTAIAAKNTGRNFIGIEKDEKYYNRAVKRIK